MAFGNANTGEEQTTGTTTQTNGKSACEWAKLQFNSLDGDITTKPDGTQVKELQMNGVLNFMMNIGYQAQEDQGYPTRVALPEEGEDNSQEELDHIKQFPTNYFKWVKDNRTGKQERKQFRPVNPEQEMILAFDFQDVQLDYAQNPYSELEEDIKPLRVSWNGWFWGKKTLNTHVKNTIRYGEKTISDKNPLYKIAKAGGVLDKYLASGSQNEGHDYSILAGATVGLTVIAMLKEYNNKFYVDYILKEPKAITDVKVGNKVVASKEDMVASAQVSVPFVGLEFHDTDFVYEKTDLEFIRYEWKIALGRAKAYQPNSVKAPDYWKGKDWEESTLYKALEKEGMLIGGGGDKPKQEAKPDEEPKKETPKKLDEPKPEEGGMDFDDDIPF